MVFAAVAYTWDGEWTDAYEWLKGQGEKGREEGGLGDLATLVNLWLYLALPADYQSRPLAVETVEKSISCTQPCRLRKDHCTAPGKDNLQQEGSSN